MFLPITGPLHILSLYLKHDSLFEIVLRHLLTWPVLTHLSSSSTITSEKPFLAPSWVKWPWYEHLQRHVPLQELHLHLFV